MTIYEFAPARLNGRQQQSLGLIVAVITLAVLAGGLFLFWPSHYTYWVQVSLIILAVALASAFVYRVSSIDRLFAFGLTASILAVLGPFDNPAFLVTIWSIGVLIGLSVMNRSLFVATQATLCMWFSAGVLVAVWQAAEAWLEPYENAEGDLLGIVTSAHIPQMMISLLAFYIARICISTVRALMLTRLTLKEILLRVSWVRVSIMLVGEWIVACAVNASSGVLNNFIFRTESPYGKTTLIVLISTTIFGLAAIRQSQSALQRVNSLVDATEQLPWPENTPVHLQAAEFAQQALPMYEISHCEKQHTTSRDHVRSIPIENDGASFSLVAVRKAGKPPFRVEDQRMLTSIAQVANETIRGRKEVHRLRRLANTDRLTGLLNYRAFQIALDDLSERHSPDDLVALIFIDVDNFKSINDTYGHEVGNTVLKIVAERLQANIAPPGMLARVGGDEFAIILQHLASRAEAEGVQQQLAQRVSLPIEVDGHMLSLRISQGIAYSTPGQQDLSSLVELADRRMYESRGNRLEPAPGTFATEERLGDARGIVSALREGILQRRLQLVYQPVVDLDSQQVVAIEALMRYTDPVHGVVPVALVLGEAERLGLLPALSEQLLELAVHTLERIRERYPDLRRVHLNISLAQLIDDTFTRMVDELTAQHPEFELVLEVNESSLRDSSPQTIEIVEDYARRSHARLAVDDIGKTYTGLASLRDFPFSVWKVDCSVMQHFRHERTAPLVRGLLSAANELQIDLIFEGVETEAQHEWLRSLGARFGQGYLYGRPVTVEELLLRFETAGVAARL